MYGTQQYPESFTLQSQISAFAQKLTVTDKAWRDQGKIEVEFISTDSNGKESSAKQFLPYAEAVMNDTLYASIETQLWLGKKMTRLGDQTTKYITRTGPGVREQMKDGNNEYFSNTLTTTRLQNYVMSVANTRLSESERALRAGTGALGKLKFHSLLAAEARSFLTMDTNYIAKTDSTGRNPNLAFGAQFTEYRGTHGVNISLFDIDIYDNKTIDKKVNPLYPQYTRDSSRLTFLDFGANRSMGGKQNIQMITQKDTFGYGYIPGTYTPMGPVKGGAVNSMIAGYTHYVTKTAGVVVFDATRGGELIEDFE